MKIELELESFECTIETPQFRSDGTIRKFYKQFGVFFIRDLLFMPYSLFGHGVQFQTLDQLEKHRIN